MLGNAKTVADSASSAMSPSESLPFRNIRHLGIDAESLIALAATGTVRAHWRLRVAAGALNAAAATGTRCLIF